MYTSIFITRFYFAYSAKEEEEKKIRHELLAYMSICHTIEYVHIETNNFAI